LKTFLVEKERVKNGKAYIVGEEFHHAYHVLRIRKGEKVRGIDGKGKEFLLRVIRIHPKKEVIETEVIKSNQCEIEPSLEIYLAFGLMKAPRMGYLIEKCTELGVKGFIPFISERTVVKSLEKKKRWVKIAVSAIKQCGRAQIPDFWEPMTFSDVLGLRGRFSQGLLATSRRKNLKEIEVKERVLLLIGPEGGFTGGEIEMAERAGFELVSLGKSILRSETAAVVGVSNLFYEKADL